MIIKDYTITLSKVNRDLMISIFSDIHYSNIFKRKRLEEIKKSLLKNKPDYICIPGDIVDITNILDNEEKRQILVTFFKDLGKIAPTFVSLGNHDYYRRVNNKIQEDYHNFWKQEFKKLVDYNVIFLDNEVYEERNIRFIGYNPPYFCYNSSCMEEINQLFVNNFNKVIPKIDDYKLNILMCHSPINITNEEVIKNMFNFNNFDIIISGHMHNGMVPNILDKVFPKNRGLIAPDKSLYPNNARGIKKLIVDDKEITVIISGGITKIQETAPKILHFGDYLYRPQLENLKIKILDKK